MSNVNRSDKNRASLPQVQGSELDSIFTSENFEVLCCDTSQNVNMYDRNYFASSSKTPSNSFLERSPKQFSHQPEASRTLDVDGLIQSHIAADDELNFYGQESNSKYCHNGDNTSRRTNSFKIQPTSSNVGSPSKSCEESAIDSKKSKANSSSSFHLGQMLSRRKDSELSKISSSDDLTVVDDLALNSKPFVFKKQNITYANDNPQQTQMKTKLRTMWNNMKYGWRVKREVNLKLDSATWLLGQCYHNKLADGSVSQDVSKQLKLDLLSKIWLTYRINFPTIPGTDFVSDSGWGCMLRCGQMMMAQALVCHFLDRDWRVSPDQPPEKKLAYKMILRWFGDSLSEHSPFSLHHLVSLGESYGRKAGDWYGPTHASQVLRDALIQAKRDIPELRDVCMYVALDGIVFKQDVMDLCLGLSAYKLPTISDLPEGHQIQTSYKLIYPNPFTVEQKYSMQSESCKLIYPNPFSVEQNYSKQSESYSNHDLLAVHAQDCIPSNKHDDAEINFTDPCPSYSEFGPPSFSTVEPKWTSLILFVSVRLGNDKINPFYIPCLKSLLAYERCIGIIGGRPKHALYFIGWQDDKLLHMDPHSCQPAIDVEKDDFNEKSFHSSSIRTISFSEMDPSCAIGFYFRKRKEFDHFVEKFSEITAPMKRNLDYPVFALAEGKRVDVEEVDTPHGYARSSLSHNSSKTDEDDYILL